MWEKEKLLVTSNFCFSHNVFQKACFQGASKGVIVWEWVKSIDCKKSSPPFGHVLRWIKISPTVFEKGHPRKNPVKLFQILINGLRGEEF